MFKSVFIGFIGIIAILLGTTTYSQDVSRVSISGTVRDTLNEPVQSATVMLLHRSDSTLANFTTTNRSGEFNFNHIRNDDYLLKLSHVSLMPREIRIRPSEVSNVELGDLVMYPISEVLMEVVVRAAQAPISFRGDTVEYDARMFRIPPGSSVEDLLKQLPGIEVDDSGNISAQGENIGRVFVDGRVFFSDDPRVVTRNLDAEAVSRVQIYNNKSEQERLTGLADGAHERVMNLELKDEYKSGYFGKASLGGGTDDRWTGSGSFNKFDEKQQLSFILYGNNVNQTNLNWDDYSEFMGMSASNFDNGDFGFSNDRQHVTIRHGIGQHFDGRGFTENYGGGVNYNYFTKKSNFNASYFYHQTDLNYQQFSDRHTFLVDTSFYKTDTIVSGQFRNNHRFSGRGEIEIDSSNTIIASINYSFSNNNQNQIQDELFRTQDFTPLNLNSTTSSNEIESGNLNSLIIYNHKFNKPRRSFSASASFDVMGNEDYENIENLNEFLLTTDITERINLRNYHGTSTNNLKSSLLYVEPITNRINLNAFYNFSRQSGYTDKQAESEDAIVDSLSVRYDFNTFYNRVGSSLSYNYDGINIFVGGAVQRIDLIGKYRFFDTDNNINRNYLNFVPNVSGSVQFSTQSTLSFNYRYAISEPSISQLHPAPNLSNPLYRIEGNPSLDPARFHSINTHFRYWNQASLASFSTFIYYSLFDSRIIYNQNTTFIDGVGFRTISKPENVDGGSDFYIGTWINFPIVRTVLTMSLSPNLRTSNSPIFINNIENITNTQSYNFSGRFNLTLGPKLSFNMGARYAINNTSYSIQSSLDREILSTSASAGINWQFLEKTYLQANYRYNRYNNDGFDNDTEISLLNVSLRQLLGEKNQFEVRLAALDIFNQQQHIRQFASQNYIVYSESPTLSRYFMLTISYNLRGFETNMRRH